jgi:p-aminobenzoyl-glutamate transporter AbgT
VEKKEKKRSKNKQNKKKKENIGKKKKKNKTIEFKCFWLLLNLLIMVDIPSCESLNIHENKKVMKISCTRHCVCVCLFLVFWSLLWFHYNSIWGF